MLDNFQIFMQILIISFFLKKLFYLPLLPGYSEDLINKTSALGYRLINKMLFKCLFLVFGLYSDVEELSTLCVLTSIAGMMGTRLFS